MPRRVDMVNDEGDTIRTVETGVETWRKEGYRPVGEEPPKRTRTRTVEPAEDTTAPTTTTVKKKRTSKRTGM